jgi:magnesium-transporting ATPase (P-type)
VIPGSGYATADEQDMVFAGFLLFFDPLEEGVRNTLSGLRRLRSADIWRIALSGR